MLVMTHPDVEGFGLVADEATFNAVWQPRGWELGEPDFEDAGEPFDSFTVRVLTDAEYDALGEETPDTIYITTG